MFIGAFSISFLVPFSPQAFSRVSAMLAEASDSTTAENDCSANRYEVYHI